MAVDNLVEGIANAGLKPLRIGVEDRIEQGLEKWTMEVSFKLFTCLVDLRMQ